MFSNKKRVKKNYPPGTFIPTPARVCAIIQLCLAFSVLLWNFAQPFMGELFSIKSQQLLFEDVMGIKDKSILDERALFNQQHFKELSQSEKSLLLDGYKSLQEQLQRPFLQKLRRGFSLLFEMPLFEQGWLLLSIAVPIMLLKRIEGAAMVVWLLPLLAVLYGLDDRLHSPVKPKGAEEQLFPSEHDLVANYYKKPLSKNIAKQQEELKEAWKTYLIEKWSPGNVSDSMEKRHMEGEFRFNLERVKLQMIHGSMKAAKAFGASRYQEPLIFIAVYIFWNIFFGFIVLRTCRQRAVAKTLGL